MLNENIKFHRKEKGFSRETLARELNVVRQTVSKWEKGLSVPDAEMLTKISEVLEVPVMTLLGGKVEESEKKSDNSDIANRLYILNNQFAKELYRRKKIRRIVLTVLVCLVAVLPILCFWLSVPKAHPPVTNAYRIEFVESDIFTQEEIDRAISSVVDIFEKDEGYKSCRLDALSYAGDNIVKREMKYHDGAFKKGELIVIKTVFTTGKQADDAFNSNFTYDNWYWILEKTTGGNWVELDHGFL